MRYSVTVKKLDGLQGALYAEREVRSRRTGLTLGDAAQAAWQVLYDRGNHPAVALGTVSSKISEEGGTIRLPDGTVIVVECEEES